MKYFHVAQRGEIVCDIVVLYPEVEGPAELAEGTDATPLQGLRKVITLRHAIAIYVSSVLGAGILVIPGLAAKVAGPASLVAWALLSLASYPFAYTFATLSARKPDSGGIYAFAKESFGPGVGTMTAWLFVAWVVMGAPAITLAAGSYLSFAFPMNREGIFAVAAGILLISYGINFGGIRLSGRVQIALVSIIVVLLSVVVLASAPRISAANFAPVLPGGIVSVGVASALIVWSYLGYENVSNIAEEFENPKRDFGRSVRVSVLLIGVLYFAVAFAIVGTGDYKVGGGVTPFAELLSNAFGPYGGAIVSLLAVVIIFSTVNAYTAGMARVVYAAARDGSLPTFFGRVDERSGVPRRSLLGLLALIIISLVAYYSLQLDIQTGFLATSGAAVMTYVVGSSAGVRLLKEQGAAKALPWISLIVSLAILPFIGVLLLPSIVVAVLGLLYGRRRASRMSVLKGPAA